MKSILNTFYSDFLVQPFSERTINIYSRVILDFIGGLRPTLTNVIDTTPADIQRYLSELLKDGKSNATYNQSLAALSAFFKFCYNYRIIYRKCPTACMNAQISPLFKLARASTLPAGWIYWVYLIRCANSIH